MQRLRRLRRGVPRGRYRHGKRQGAADARRLLRWPGRLLPTCPTGAISFVEREAAAYDEQAVLENKQKKMQKEGMTLHHSCPGMQLKTFAHKAASETAAPAAQESQLSQWPVQIKLVPVNAPYFSGAKLLIAADCTAYAYAAFHEKFIKGPHYAHRLPEARQRGLQRKS